MNTTKHLDLGCGRKPRNPYKADMLYGLDLFDNEESTLNQNFVYRKCNVAEEPLPFEDSFFESVSAFDFIEHIPRVIYINGKNQNAFINLMNEIYRVLKNNGKFYAITPCYPSIATYTDPTHVNYITDRTHLYFTAPTSYAKMYNFKGEFEIIKVEKVNFAREYYYPTGFKKSIHKLVDRYKKNYCEHILWEFIALK